MKNNRNPLRRRIRFIPYLFSFLAASSLSYSAEVTFTQPAAGTVYRVGDTLRVRFQLAPDAVWGNQIFDFSVENGLMVATLTDVIRVSLSDTINRTGGFDWVIPDSLRMGRDQTLSTVSNACELHTRPYPSSSDPPGSRGTSGVFTILPRLTSVRRGLAFGTDSRSFPISLRGDRIGFSASLEGTTELFLVNVAGRTIVRASGLRDSELTVGGLPQGMYLVRARTAEEMYHGRLTTFSQR